METESIDGEAVSLVIHPGEFIGAADAKDLSRLAILGDLFREYAYERWERPNRPDTLAGDPPIARKARIAALHER